VIIDLQDATCDLRLNHSESFGSELKLDRWPASNKVAMVSPRDGEQYDQLLTLARDLSRLGYRIAVFTDSKSAVNWLTEPL
jgi:hypothetical protein